MCEAWAVPTQSPVGWGHRSCPPSSPDCAHLCVLLYSVEVKYSWHSWGTSGLAPWKMVGSKGEEEEHVPGTEGL